MPLTPTTVPAPKSTQTTPALSAPAIDKPADQQVSEGAAAPDQPEVETRPELQSNK